VPGRVLLVSRRARPSLQPDAVQGAASSARPCSREFPGPLRVAYRAIVRVDEHEPLQGRKAWAERVALELISDVQLPQRRRDELIAVCVGVQRNGDVHMNADISGVYL
jgi:hypothetical protein